MNAGVLIVLIVAAAAVTVTFLRRRYPQPSDAADRAQARADIAELKARVGALERTASRDLEGTGAGVKPRAGTSAEE